jgi:beta-phosphoglucomutase
MTNSSIHDFCSQFDSNSVLLFDLDGTLVQTDTANNSAYLFAVKEILGIELKRQYDLGFRITREKLAYLLPEATANQLNQIIATKEKYLSLIHI